MRAILLALLCVALPAMAEEEDSAALSLADKPAAVAEPGKDWHSFIEAAWSHAENYTDFPGNLSLYPTEVARLSIDTRYDSAFAPGWRAVFADRLDANWNQDPSSQDRINTLKEAYLSWQVQPDWIADAGRINAHYGVAYGYNPSDIFRAGAVRSIVSIDPASLRENRLGTAMLKGQTLWSDGSLTALYSPKLEHQPSNAAFSPDFGATNNRDRWLLSASTRLSDALNPQWIVYGGSGQSVQMGLNLTGLLNDATVCYFEWSGGREPGLLAQALSRPDDTGFHSRMAAGVSYTSADKLSVTAEYEYNGIGLDQSGWDALRRGPLPIYGQYRLYVASLQDMPTRQRVFLRAAWQDAWVNHLDLTSNVFIDQADSSRQVWFEARYHWTQVDAALQWQLNSGRANSEFGGLPQQRVWQALSRYFF